MTERDTPEPAPETGVGTPMPSPSPDAQRPVKLIRIAAMVKELLGDVRQSSPDEAGGKRLREARPPSCATACRSRCSRSWTR